MSETTAMRRRREIEFLARAVPAGAGPGDGGRGPDPGRAGDRRRRAGRGDPAAHVAQQLDNAAAVLRPAAAGARPAGGRRAAVRAAARREPRRRAGPEMSFRIAGPPTHNGRPAEHDGEGTDGPRRAFGGAEGRIRKSLGRRWGPSPGARKGPGAEISSSVSDPRNPSARPEPAGNVRSPKVGQRYHDLVKEAHRDRVGLARAVLPGSDRHRTCGRQLCGDLCPTVIIRLRRAPRRVRVWHAKACSHCWNFHRGCPLHPDLHNRRAA